MTRTTRLALGRRHFLLGAASLALSGCDETNPVAARALQSASDLTYKVQRALRGDKLAPEYPRTAISAAFKANGSIDPKDPAYRQLAANGFAGFTLAVDGLVEHPRGFTLDELRAFPARTQITRHDCVEGWSCIGEWTGVPLKTVLDIVGVKPEARYVVFHCFDRYDTDYSTDPVSAEALADAADQPTFYGSIGLDDAVHPQTILAYAMNGETLPVAHGAPLRVRVERLLGYKMTKYIRRVELVSDLAAIGEGKGGYWEDNGYDWYGGI